MRTVWAVLIAATTCALNPLPVAAQQREEVFQRSFPTQLFETAIGVKDTFLTVEGATVADHLAFGIGLTLNYQHKPLVLFIQQQRGGGGSFDLGDATEVALVRNQLTAELYGAVGLRFGWFRAQLGLALPVNLVLRGDNVNDRGQLALDNNGQAEALTGEGIGDLRLQIKLLLLNDWNGVSIALSPIITIPTACLAAGGLGTDCDQGKLGGDPHFGIRPRAVIDWRWRKLYTAINLGYLFRIDEARAFSSEIGSRLLYGAAAGYQLHSRVFAMAEIFGQAGFSTKSNCSFDPVQQRTVCTDTSNTDLDAFPLELDLGAQVALPKGFVITASVGFGLIKAIGSPQFRFVTGVRWAPDFKDTDKDGIYDADDACPTEPEDKDGFQDADGCPDPDNDGDLIPDAQDKCPNEAEDKDTFEDTDGCPEADNDKDGIPDLKDACPNKPETKNNFKDDDGCPDVPDQDGDGIPDTDDRCPKEKEDIDKFQDQDGCPDPDNDGDSVPDSFDDCPLQPEDMDGFSDDDGCPDPDNDNDGIPDAKDKCPNKKETINGYRDNDGCPDKGNAHVIIKANKIVITKKIYFSTGRAKIKRRSFGILDEVALTLQANQQIKGIRIEGHTDSRGKRKRNLKLSQARAESVRTYLVGKGVSTSRLFAVGYGPDKPISSNRTRRGRADNRRVEFVILEQAPAASPKPRATQPPATPESGKK